MLENRAQIQWVRIGEIMPNPLNPRKNDAVKTEEMQDIIKKRGWEEPLTCYQKGRMYVLLSGHRRLYAAKEAGVREVPIYVVDAPQDHQDEIERIASLQSGRVDWTTYEWAKFTYERWLAWDKPNITKFARELSLNRRSVEAYIKVFEYYPIHEISTELQTGVFSISTLDQLRLWIAALIKFKPGLVEALTEEMIRKVMLQKIRDKTVTNEALRNKDYPAEAPEESIKEFLIDKDKVLDAEIGYHGIKKKYRDFNGHLISIGLMKQRIPNMRIETDRQKELAIEALKELEKQIQEQLKKIDR